MDGCRPANTRAARKSWSRTPRCARATPVPSALDNNLCERALKMAIRHRKNSLFYKTLRGAAVGDLYMSLIH
ncbi:MAG: transposase, partial [Planctomycetota bacterium]|nr:transposase [Planctomycetota bacterium]